MTVIPPGLSGTTKQTLLLETNFVTVKLTITSMRELVTVVADICTHRRDELINDFTVRALGVEF